MNSVNFIIISCFVSIFVLGVTYIIQFYSKISPCNIEFDGKSRREMELMKNYNELFDRIFYIAGSVIMLFTSIFIFIMDNMFVVLMVLELLYFVCNIMCMMIMYIRSIIYFSRKYETIRAIKS